jgi:hypothetical protein
MSEDTSIPGPLNKPGPAAAHPKPKARKKLFEPTPSRRGGCGLEFSIRNYSHVES